MTDNLFDNPEAAFLVVATAITILILLSRLFLKSCALLWKGTLISYVLFLTLIFMGTLCEHSYLGNNRSYYTVLDILSKILLTPSMFICCILMTAKMCPSNEDVFAWYMVGYLFYTLVILGIMKVIKLRKETKAIEKKQGDKSNEQISAKNEEGLGL